MTFRTVCLLVGATCASTGVLGQQPPPVQPTGAVAPDQNLPPHILKLTGFGERGDFSLDGTRVLFLSKTFGDAMEVELATGVIRNLTAHFPHHGFTRALYLANGQILLSGPTEFDASNPGAARLNCWLSILDPAGRERPHPLGVKAAEGPVPSRTRLHLAWSYRAAQFPGEMTPGSSQIHEADIVYENGVPTLANQRTILDSRDLPFSATIEPQNYRRPLERELVFSAYDYQQTEVFGLDVATGTLTNYSNAPGVYDEPEGIFPSGEYTTVESDRHNPAGKGFDRADIHKLRLDGSGAMERLTYFADVPTYRASNPVVSDDGRYMAFQMGRSGVAAGIGYGLFLYDFALAAHPTAVIADDTIRATLYLPDAARGFYRSTRFDWSGIVASLEHDGHQYYGPWFTGSEPAVRDFIYRGAGIIAGPESSMVGPAEEFPVPQGFDTAAVGGTFVKVGVGVLRRPDAAAYSAFKPYELVDAGTWAVETSDAAVTFVQSVSDPTSGYGYVYRKSVRLTGGGRLQIEHRLENTGRRPLETTQYNHNFLVLDGATTGPDFTIALPFAIRTPRPPDAALAVIRGGDIHFTKTLTGQERVSFPIEGFGAGVGDYDVRVENRRTGAGVRVTSDRPLVRAMLWSIRSVISLEPFVDVSTKPGEAAGWTYTYTYYTSR